MTDRLPVLRSSVQHLSSVVNVEAFNPDASAYPTEWTIADTMSHIGSGAVILKKSLENTVAIREADGGFNQSVWDAWNAKAPTDQVADSLVANADLIESLESLSEEQRNDFHFSMGPFNLDFDGFVGMRLNEQALQTWAVDVALNPSATLSSDVAGAIIDNLSIIVGFAGKANGEVKDVTVRTTDPSRDFTLAFAGEKVNLVDATHTGAVDFELPAEAFVRLVYGRLDADNAPAGIDERQLKSLQKTFPGF